jgi:hypothetical protein
MEKLYRMMSLVDSDCHDIHLPLFLGFFDGSYSTALRNKVYCRGYNSLKTYLLALKDPNNHKTHQLQTPVQVQQDPLFDLRR